MPKNRNDITDKGERIISIEPFLIACQTNDRIKRFVQRNISVKARILPGPLIKGVRAINEALKINNQII